MEKIIIDADPGKDDALAIILLALSKKADIQAITTTAGNCSLQNATNNAQFILNQIKSKTPLYSGASKPLSRELILANVHGNNGLSGVEVSENVTLTNNAPEKIIEIVRNHPNQISIIAIGPETNIAQAFLKDPELPKLLKQLIIMGGAINCPGNKNRVAEFNIFVDPEAADIVFNSGAPITLIPLDVCNVTPLFMEDFNRITNPQISSMINSIMVPYIKAIKQFEGQEGALVYDALAAYYLINPSAFETTPMDVRIETKGVLTVGMSVADKRTWGEKNLNTQVAMSLNREIFLKDFLDILNQN